MKKPVMSKALKRLLSIVGWTGVSIAFVIIMGAAVGRQRMTVCRTMNVNIDNDKGLFFINEQDVRRSFKAFCGDDIEGTPMKLVDIELMEDLLERNPFVDQADIYAGVNGQLNVKIRQKEPLVRVINRDGVSFYITKKGLKIPSSSNFTSRVPVATGHIPITHTEGQELTDGSVLKDLYVLGRFIDADPFWKALIEQIHVDEKGELELVPMIGSHTVLIGKADDLEAKFRRLRIFYKEVLKNVDEEKYRTVNVQFDDQVICTKYF